MSLSRNTRYKYNRSTILSSLSTLVRSQTRLHLMVSRLFDARFLVDEQLQRITLGETCYDTLRYTISSEPDSDTHVLPCRDSRNFLDVSAEHDQTATLDSESCTSQMKLRAQSTRSHIYHDSSLPPTTPTKTRCQYQLRIADQQNQTQRERRLLEKRDGIDRELELCFAALTVVSVKFTRMVQILGQMDHRPISYNRPTYESSD